MSSAARSSRSSFARYLHSLAVRREIHEGLNTIERWNGANDFVYFARRGEMTSNRREDEEISMLSLHLLQNCMVYVNTPHAPGGPRPAPSARPIDPKPISGR